MKVLVTAASKHGSTAEMAKWIGDDIAEAGMDVVVRAPMEIESLDGVDAVILGSGVYAGKWLGDATHLVDRLGPELRSRPVWIFSSGPAGHPPKPDTDPVDAADLILATHARGHRLFGGKIDRQAMGFAEWAVVTALRVPNGDYRPRDDVRAWALDIARDLRDGAAPPVRSPIPTARA